MSDNTNTELLKFFKWWLREAQSQLPNRRVTKCGLCCLIPPNLSKALEHLLESNVYTSEYPFGGVRQYFKDNIKASMHLNLERIAFVESQIERLEKLNV